MVNGDFAKKKLQCSDWKAKITATKQGGGLPMLLFSIMFGLVHLMRPWQEVIVIQHNQHNLKWGEQIKRQ